MILLSGYIEVDNVAERKERLPRFKVTFFEGFSMVRPKPSINKLKCGKKSLKILQLHGNNKNNVSNRFC